LQNSATEPSAPLTKSIAVGVSARAALRELEALRQIAIAALEAAPLPAAVAALLDSLEVMAPPADLPLKASRSDEQFKSSLVAAMPALRAYARSLSGNADLADDLLQETMLKAWNARRRFIAGTNMRAWTHVILRNTFYSQARRLRFRGEWDPVAADLILAVPPSQDSHMALVDLQRALMQLPVEQREAVVMMGAGGMSCEDVAVVCGCATGTVKSRVARGRESLRLLLENGQLKKRRADTPKADMPVLDQIMLSAKHFAEPRLANLQPG
jgi:RNA polymerase sigma factor (sigma-70 family)